MSFVQPYLLTEMLQVPQSEQGVLTGNLAAMQELIIIALASFVGAWSDQVGRRRVYCIGFLAMALGYAVYPLADSVLQLYLLRCVFAVGVAIAPLMLSACVVDSPQEVSRGRWIGSNNLLQGLGVVLMSALLAKSPAWFIGRGADPVEAGRFAFWLAAALCLVAAAAMAAGLPRHATRSLAGRGRGSLLAQVRAAARVAGSNPRLALAYSAAFIGRGDFTVVGVYFSLWLVQVGLEEGMTAGAALARAGMLFGIVQAAAMGWAFFMGMIADRSNRVTALGMALGLAGMGYLLTGQVEDPFARSFIPVAVLLGIGEVSVIVTGGALLGQEVPAHNRGPLVGFYNAIGGVGILFATYVGGQLFDGIGRTAPFTMMGLLNLALFAVALLVRARAGAPQARPAAPAEPARGTNTGA
jgi:MFS family permease